ncbi:hypothetical protein KXR53_02375 [Inquilinus limosus]|uniref:hypothetical protein n=1 Tax=Inquilinus limosus TaxID=171674 RepID=UPI003F139B28
MQATRRAAEHSFLRYFAAFLALGAGLFLVMLYTLRALGSLPAPPLTGTFCIDEKFKFLAEQELADVDLLAVGSSVTWRNIDFTPFVANGLSEHPLNAAPCLLYMHQTAFFTEFLLDHLKNVRTVITVVAPRDFETCPESGRSFFYPEQAAPYVFRDSSPLLIYAANFRPLQLIRDARHVARRRSDPASGTPIVMGPFGSGPMEGTTGWNPAPSFDDKCFQALAAFEKMLAGRGVELILISFPLHPAWHSKYDPEGQVSRAFEAQLKASLSQEETVFVSSRGFSPDGALYVDAVHFNWRGARLFSAALADRLGPVLTPIAR